MRASVSKMHGARNDFVVLDRRVNPISDLASFARWACDRRAGIGADGVIAIEPSAVADVRMQTINADGSMAEMCGNGIRCAARWLDEAGEGAKRVFETDAGPIATEVIAREPEYLVRVAMGRPALRSMHLPEVGDVTIVDLGNPHVVVWRERSDANELESIARRIEASGAFADGVNVHVVTPRAQRGLNALHWERGVGATMACGTGAVACAAVALERGSVASPVEIFVPGGRLVVEWNQRDGAFLIGPAVRVFDANIAVADEIAE